MIAMISWRLPSSVAHDPSAGRLKLRVAELAPKILRALMSSQIPSSLKLSQPGPANGTGNMVVPVLAEENSEI